MQPAAKCPAAPDGTANAKSNLSASSSAHADGDADGGGRSLRNAQKKCATCT
jgi:hypothetical protein